MVAGSLIFAAPAWFLALLVVPAAGFILWRLSQRIARRRMERFFSPSLLPGIMASVDWRRKRLRFLLAGGVLVLLAITMARPLTGPRSEADERLGADIVVALDVSKSMWAEDVPPNRLEAVKKALSEWILGQKTDRIGLVLFAGKAFVQAPLTHDYTALDFVLREAGPRSISKKGSNIPEAIEAATQMMRSRKIESKILILITDGENLEGDAIAAARKAKQADGLTIYTVGVGTAAGSRVSDKERLKPGENKPAPWVRSQYGSEVVSRLDSQALRAIASVSGGQYFEFRPGDNVFQDIRAKNVRSLLEKSRHIKTRDYDEWFQIPLAAAILLIVLEPLLGRPRKKVGAVQTGVPVVKPVSFSTPQQRPAARVAAVAAIFVGMSCVQASPPSLDDAEKLFAAGKADEAVAALKENMGQNPTDPYAGYNYALGLYRAGRYDEARTVFQSVDSLGDDPKLKAQVLFQLGTIALRKGVASLQPGPNRSSVGAVRAFEEALGSYEAQLQVQGTREAKDNLETVKIQLEKVLLEIGGERTKAYTEKTLREALQAFERAAELNSKNQPLVDNAKKMLSNELRKNADKADAEADKAQSELKTISEKEFQKLYDQRETITGKLEEAIGLTPGDQGLKEELKKQQADLSDLLTRAAKDQTAKAMQTETFFGNNQLKSLEDGSAKLDEAQALNPDNKEAAEFGAQVKAKLEDAYMANGDLAMKHLQKSLEADKTRAEADGKDGKKPGVDKAQADSQLQDALEASKSYSGALNLAPGNKEAQKGLAEANALLPELYSKAGTKELAKVESALKGKLPDTPPPGENAAADQAPKASPGDLRAASASLEKAMMNLGAAAGMKPENAKYQEDLKKAEALMGSVRAELEKAQGLAAAKAPGEGPGAGEGQPGGEGEGGTGKGKGEGKSNGQSALKSMSALRGEGGETGGGQGGESKRYWEKFVQDW